MLTFQTPLRNVVQGEFFPGAEYGYMMEPYSSEYVVTRAIKVVDEGLQGMKRLSDGSWQGMIGSHGPYHMRRIIREDGSKDDAFSEYRAAAVGHSVEVLCRTQVVDVSKPGASVAVPAGGEPTYVQLSGATGGTYRLHLASAAPITAVVYNPGAATTNEVKATEVVMSQSRDDDIAELRSAAATTVQLSVSPEEVAHVTNESPDFRLKLVPGEEQRVRLGLVGGAPSGLYEVVVDADEPLALRTFGQASYRRQNANNYETQRPSLVIPLQSGQSDEAELILRTTGAGGDAQISLRPAVTKDVDKGKIIVDGPAIETSLADVLTTDMFTIEVPTGMKIGAYASLVLYVTPVTGDPACCMIARAYSKKELEHAYRSRPAVGTPMVRNELTPGVSEDAQGGQVWVDFVGDRNSLKPALKYKLELKKEASGRPW